MNKAEALVPCKCLQSVIALQAIVNERVDYRALNSELAAAMEGRDQKSALLERSLLAKESELESMHALLRVSSTA